MNFSEDDYIEVTRYLSERYITTRILHHLDIHTFMHAFGNLYPPYDQVITDEGRFNSQFVNYCRQNGIDLSKTYSEIMNQLSRDYFKRKAVHEVLVEKGYRVLPSGDDAWTEPGTDNQLKKTARRLGVTSKRHFGTIDYELEKIIMGYQADEISRPEIEDFIYSHRGVLTNGQSELLKYFGFL